MIILNDIIQGSPEWKKEKLGKPSASRFSDIITTAGQVSKSREGYMHELAAERVSGVSAEGYKNAYMQEGNDRESESRALYEMLYNVEVAQCGVIYKDEGRYFLCSPDGLPPGYGLEMKNVLPKTQVKYLLGGNLPMDYWQQIQGSLYITGYDRWDFLSYSPGLPPLILEVRRDEKFIAILAKELDSFCVDLARTVEKLKKLQ
jgi:hypothetical protein